jgi:hypothetical protein
MNTKRRGELKIDYGKDVPVMFPTYCRCYHGCKIKVIYVDGRIAFLTMTNQHAKFAPGDLCHGMHSSHGQGFLLRESYQNEMLSQKLS